MYIRPREAGEGDRPAGAVEGASDSKHRRRHSDDGISRFINVVRQVVCGDAHHRHSMRVKPSVATHITLWPLAHVVTYPVDFDRKPCLGEIKIEYVRANRMLSTKYRLAVKSGAQSTP